jgi:Ca2+-binding EF-hand superfamily protein
LGDKLTEAEVDELLKGVEIGKDGAINYEGNFKHLLSSSFLLIFYCLEFVKMLINS